MDNDYILLVEDNPGDAALTMRALKKGSINNEVVLAQDGVEALDFLDGTTTYQGRNSSTLPKVIFLDLKLPRVDGFEVLKHVRSTPRTRLLPVVILTSSGEEKDVLNGYHLGANSYIRKPVNYNQLAETIRQMGLYWLNLNESAPARFQEDCG